jgi:hypothetical protein
VAGVTRPTVTLVSILPTAHSNPPVRRRLHLVIVMAALVAIALPSSALADVSATCTTDTTTTYCAQLPQGTNATAAGDGLVIVEATFGVIIAMTTGVVMLRKLFAAAGWAPW